LPELKSQGKTVLVITHDDRYFHLADRLIKLANGRIEYDQLEHSSQVTLFADKQSIEVLVPIRSI
jgi:ABC-type siderophore export system fused ATPase/permease subunit